MDDQSRGDLVDPAEAGPTSAADAAGFERVYAMERPSPVLWQYYLLFSLLGGPIFFIFMMVLRFRYRTLRYTFDDEGIGMRWGVLFRREIHLTYERIQDIHLVSNAVERWLGLGRVKIQTASGSSKAEMTIEGLEEFELVRDFLYARMRGQRPAPSAAASGADSEVAATLRQAAAELRAVR
jgi:putative membrane protein